MKKIQTLLRVIGIVQLILGVLYLVMPIQFLSLMGHTAPANDVAYPLGMLAARFLAYGAGMLFIARKPQEYKFWVNNMILVQAIDLAVGLFYTITGNVTLMMSGFPMFNATVFIVLLVLWRPKTR